MNSVLMLIVRPISRPTLDATSPRLHTPEATAGLSHGQTKHTDQFDLGIILGPGEIL